ncbi:Protein ALWAYS EARLY 3 [Linum perenne]
MAPSRKSRSVNKRFSGIDEVDTNGGAEYANKSRQKKRKWTGKLGPKWTKEELERFYKAYRKHGKDWEKVAAVVRSRSVEMVEALYSMNTAYLSLPKGYASAAGLIAMMTDHYSNQGDSDSEQEVNEGPSTSHKPQKRTRVTKGSDGSPVTDLSKSLSAASDYGCMSLLKRRRSESRPWAVGKRTPRVPVSYTYEKDKEEKYISPIRQGLKFKAGTFDDDDDGDDDVTHRLALALTVASQRGPTQQVSQTLTRKRGSSSSAQNGEQMRADSEMTSAKLRCSEMDDSGCELSLGSTEADTGDFTRDKRFLKGKRYQRWRSEPEESMDNHLDEIKEACSGTEEGQKPAGKGRFDAEVTNAKMQRSSYDKIPKKRSKKVLFGESEDIALDALQTLADLSLRLPEPPVDTESSVHVQEGKTLNLAKSKLKGNSPTSGVKVTPSKSNKQSKAAHKVVTLPELEGSHHINAGPRKRRNKPPQSKASEKEQHSGPHLGESQKVKVVDDVNTYIDNAKLSHDATSGKQKRTTKPPERTSSNADPGKELNDSGPSAAQVVSSNQVILPTKVRSRRKISTPKPLLDKDTTTCENITNSQSKISKPSFQDRALTAKEKLSNCLSRYGPRQWCVFEWFYSAIDYPWFAKREFVEYLDHVGLGHIPRLTRVEWGVIRSSLGKPRRFSGQFLKEEKEKLYQYRESVREHYTELRAGTREGLPTDLARPLSVGQHVIALHPRTREIHDGSVLTVDHNRCCVRFERPELGVEFVMDVDCMPLNPEENLPASLNKCIENLNEYKTSAPLAEKAMEEYMKLHQENLETGSPHIPPPSYHVPRQSQGVPLGLTTPVTTGFGETINAQAANAQPSMHTHLQAKEADIQALSELTRALEKKDAVVSELKRLNEDVLENQNNGDKNNLRDSESFKKHYAAVLLQLNEINDQLSSALFSLRRRNTYQEITPAIPVMTMSDPVSYYSSLNHPTEEVQDSGSNVAEIVETSRSKAQVMVDAAMKAVTSLNKQGSNIESIEEAIDFVNNQLSADDLSLTLQSAARPPHPDNSTQDQSSSSTANAENNHTSDTKSSKNLSDLNEAQMPSELITQSVATLLMIQKCTERQFPPSDIAQVLDSAVANLKPSCSQNLPVYADIQKCMGIIRNQILALVPT